MAINALVEDLNATGVHDNFLSVGRHLAEGKWRDLCEDSAAPIHRDDTRYGLAVMLENASRYINSMDETTKAIAVGSFDKYAMPLIRAIYPELIANEIVSVQPMLGPVSLVFYMDMVYGSSKGSVQAWNGVNPNHVTDPSGIAGQAFSSTALGPENYYYSSSTISDEPYPADLAANAAATLSKVLAYPPSGTSATVTVTNNTGGAQASYAATITVSAGVATVGAVTGITTVPAGGAKVTVTYTFADEGSDKIPMLDLVLTSSAITAKTRKLRTNWSLEAAFNLRSLHGLEAEVELTAAVASDIRFEIDREIIRDIRNSASAGSVYWNTDPTSASGGTSGTSYYSYTEHKLSIVDAFVTGSNAIHKATGRGRANWILCGEKVASVVETLPGFVPNPAPSGLTKGAYRCGRLNGMWDVYKDPFYPDAEFIMGYKGSSFLEAGYVYAPYIPLYTTPTVVLDDFVARKGLATQYGKLAVNSLFYITGMVGTIIQLADKIGDTASATAGSLGTNFPNKSFGLRSEILAGTATKHFGR